MRDRIEPFTLGNVVIPTLVILFRLIHRKAYKEGRRDLVKETLNNSRNSLADLVRQACGAIGEVLQLPRPCRELARFTGPIRRRDRRTEGWSSRPPLRFAPTRMRGCEEYRPLPTATQAITETLRTFQKPPSSRVVTHNRVLRG